MIITISNDKRTDEQLNVQGIFNERMMYTVLLSTYDWKAWKIRTSKSHNCHVEPFLPVYKSKKLKFPFIVQVE